MWRANGCTRCSTEEGPPSNPSDEDADSGSAAGTDAAVADADSDPVDTGTETAPADASAADSAKTETAADVFNDSDSDEDDEPPPLDDSSDDSDEADDDEKKDASDAPMDADTGDAAAAPGTDAGAEQADPTAEAAASADGAAVEQTFTPASSRRASRSGQGQGQGSTPLKSDFDQKLDTEYSDLFGQEESEDEDESSSSRSKSGKRKREAAAARPKLSEKQREKNMAEMHKKTAKMLREQDDLKLEAHIPVRRRSQTPAPFLAFAKPLLPQPRRTQSAGAQPLPASRSGGRRMSQRDRLLKMVDKEKLSHKPKNLGGKIYLPRSKNSTELLTHAANREITLPDKKSSADPKKHGLTTLDNKSKVFSNRNITFAPLQKSRKDEVYRTRMAQLSKSRSIIVQSRNQSKMEDEEEGYAEALAPTPDTFGEAGEVDEEELDEEEELLNEEGEDNTDAGDDETMDVADGDSEDGAEDSRAPTADATKADTPDAELDDELSQISMNIEAARKNSASSPPPDVFTDGSGKAQKAVDPLAFFGAPKAKSDPPPLSASRRSSGGEGEGGRITTPSAGGADLSSRPATPVFGTPNQRNQTPELFGSGTPQEFSPFVRSVSRPRPDRRNSQTTFNQSMSASSNPGKARKVLEAPSSDVEDEPELDDTERTQASEARTPANQPRSLSSAFRPLEEPYLDENGYMIHPSTEATAGAVAPRVEREPSEDSMHALDDDAIASAVDAAASQASQSFGFESQDVGGMSQLVGMCSGVFESQTDDSGPIEREDSGDTVKQSSDGEDDDANDSASKTIVEEDEDLNAHGFVVEEAEVSGDSDDEAEDDAKGGDIDDLLADEDEDLSDDANDEPAFIDDGDDDEIARLKKRFVREADEDDLEEASELRQKKAKADKEVKDKKAEARRLRKEKKKARREARRQKRLAKESAEGGVDSEAQGGVDSETEGGVDTETEKKLDDLFEDQEPESSDDEGDMSKLEDDFKKRDFWESEQKADSEAQLLAFNEDTSHVSNMIRNTYSNSVPFGVRRSSSVGEESIGKDSGSNSRRPSAASRSGSGKSHASNQPCLLQINFEGTPRVAGFLVRCLGFSHAHRSRLFFAAPTFVYRLCAASASKKARRLLEIVLTLWFACAPCLAGEGSSTSRGFAGLISNSPKKFVGSIKRRNSYLQKTGKDKDRLLACTKGAMKKNGKSNSNSGSKGYVFSVQDEGSQSVNLFDSGSDSQAGGMATTSRKRALGSTAQNKFNTGLKRSKSSDGKSATEPKKNRFAQSSSSLFKAFEAKKPVNLGNKSR